MVVIDPMTITSNPLRPFQEVLSQQKPEISGKPYEMEAYSNEFPKSCGNVWKGAYSKHGFWYKFHWAGKEDFDKLVAWSFKQNSALLKYEYFEMGKKVFGQEFKAIVAKSVSDEFIGGITLVRSSSHFIIGCHFIVEENRHSGIGEQLLKEAIKHAEGNRETIVMTIPEYLTTSIRRFGIEPRDERLLHVVLDKPTSLATLESRNSVTAVNSSELTQAQWSSIIDYDEEASGQKRAEFLKEWSSIESADMVALFEDKKCVGFGCLRQTAGDPIRPLVVGPLYADSDEHVKQLLTSLLRSYNNSEDDYDFDPDPEKLYRRKVHFLVPEEQKGFLGILRQMTGTGEMIIMRNKYMLCSSAILPGHTKAKLFAATDLHFAFH